MIINAGLAEVVYDAHHPMSDGSVALLREAGGEGAIGGGGLG